MDGTATRTLYLARHGEALPDQSGLTENGRRQAVLLGRRLRSAPLTAVHHSPLPRAAETARLVGAELDGVPVAPAAEAADCIPQVPERSELPPDVADFVLGFLDRFPAEEREQGPAVARAALERFAGPVSGDTPRHELVVTHNFVIGWLVRAALEAPNWRWVGLNHGNGSLTVIRYTPRRPSAVLLANDMGHLPEELRWTGFPPEIRL
ncbi:histidine phosphatase family protein [Streptomyces sp. LX-29]|uniref:histidine phosphatase family protein n=1 Tax=Streptomyces sp. LX-29 TaxID=2900152 RepID=UPI00240E2398|nr:histidine phosphatase family protein [Streptomyces sp. LX-29]WFB10887.1 histidine phosphatase family protein [Streptomyces sp. LX-29]